MKVTKYLIEIIEKFKEFVESTSDYPEIDAGVEMYVDVKSVEYEYPLGIQFGDLIAREPELDLNDSRIGPYESEALIYIGAAKMLYIPPGANVPVEAEQHLHYLLGCKGLKTMIDVQLRSELRTNRARVVSLLCDAKG